MSKNIGLLMKQVTLDWETANNIYTDPVADPEYGSISGAYTVIDFAADEGDVIGLIAANVTIDNASGPGYNKPLALAVGNSLLISNTVTLTETEKCSATFVINSEPITTTRRVRLWNAGSAPGELTGGSLTLTLFYIIL